MKKRKILVGCHTLLGLVVMSGFSTCVAFGQRNESAAPGQLTIVGRPRGIEGLCPLKHTSVNADVAGFGARVHVVQTFANSSNGPIEAIYTFPLPHDAAVDRMRIKVGDRIVEGAIQRREEARRIYDAARSAGQTAGLLDQERPNIFTQSVANIMPGATVQVDISYVQVLKYEKGEFEFTFPMVVGPRYLGNAPDPRKIAPPTTPGGTRTGTTIDLNVRLDAGAPIVAMNSVLHKVRISSLDERHAEVLLVKRDEIPNRDFILRYQTATDSVQSAFLTSFDPNNGGFFNLILLPPKQPRVADVAPREMIFVMDQSGSQYGFPLEKSKELTYKLLHTMRPGDTFNVYGFNTQVRSLWPTPQPYTPANLDQAHRFLDVMVANGGTNLLEGLRAALTVPKDPRRLRVVLFNTDGYVGDEENILKEIKKDRDRTRIFTFGIGNSVNRYLIDAMSLEGKGDSEMVTLADSANAAADRFVQRLRAPVITDIKASVQGVSSSDMLPREIPDVFSDRPIIVQGRYAAPGSGSIVVTGRVGGKLWSQTLNLNFGSTPGDSCVASLWARKKVDDLKDQSYEQQFFLEDAKPKDFRSQIVDIALEFGIMTEYTSFVAVEPHVVNLGGVQRTVHVPVEMASGVSYKGVFGGAAAVDQMSNRSFDSNRSEGFSGSIGGGGFGGYPGGAGRSMAVAQKSVQFGLRRSSEMPEVLEEIRSYESVVDRRLRSVKGRVEVMIYMNKFDDQTIATLETLGLRVTGKDKNLKLLFGACNALVLKKLAGLLQVDRISPIE